MSRIEVSVELGPLACVPLLDKFKLRMYLWLLQEETYKGRLRLTPS